MRGLYAVTPDGPTTDCLLKLIDQVLTGGAVLLQYRRKATPEAQQPDEAAAALTLCQRHGAQLIVNDDFRLAHKIGADGVHLGHDDGDIEAARALLGADRLIGASCYGSLELARAAIASGADYVAFGSMFASPTKPMARRTDPSVLTAARAFGVPLAAIGGITLDNAGSLVQAGADLLAVISDVFDAGDPLERARAYGHLFL